MFTIIIPTHDRPQLLHRTLLSLAGQTFKDFTVIIVSDSATYVPPYAALSALPGRYIHVIRNGPPGPAESRNLALDIAATDYIMFLDDDDTLENTHLQGLKDALGRSQREILFCDLKVVHEERTQFPPKISGTFPVSIADVTRENVFVKNRIPNSCLLYSRDVVKSIRFDPSMVLYEDWDFLLQCLQTHDLHHVPINSVCIHKSMGQNVENLRRGTSADDKILGYTLEIYKRYKACTDEVREARRQMFSQVGIILQDEYLQ